ncbi:MAG: V-type ATP synthase subunit F [Clostridiales bacterium]|nr:V-type ATP synthase subunit F [Clostridiales bacterium]
MYKIGVIGDKDTILGFKVLGISVFPTTDAKEASRIVRQLSKDNYAIIFITEQLAKDMDETIDEYKQSVMPAIILIPNNQGALGIGMDGVKKSVEKAIGADILFGKEGR